MPPVTTTYLTLSQIIQTIVIGAGGLATAILAIYGVWSKIIKPLVTEARIKRENLAKAIAHIDTIASSLEEVSKELKPNGGGSIKDQVKQIALDVKTIRVERDATFHLSKDAMFKSNEKGFCVLANSSLCSIYGTTPEQMLGLGWLNFVIEEDKERIKEEWFSAIESGREILSYYTVINQITKSKIEVVYKAIVNRDNIGVISVIGIVEQKNDYEKAA